MNKCADPKAIYLKDYKVPDFTITHTNLTFLLEEATTQVTAILKVVRDSNSTATDIVLDATNLELNAVYIDDVLIDASTYILTDAHLTIENVPAQCDIKTIVELKPHENTSLEGLYKSSGMFCTQCEAEGFRNITPYLDRPDVMSIFTTTIIADATKYPVLLSNGNLVSETKVEGDKHSATWHDPFKKPAYLFALVAGDLHCQADTFTTMSGRKIDLKIFVEPRNADKCEFALVSLKKSMCWDEEVYGREYDLDLFMIVAVDDFNMGAMENKGLNIFNSSCVLAKPDTTTDAGFERIEGIVAHEYFHNWSGNRVTCRDWFQLSLKEGFTVFRDAEFTADMHSRTVKRIDDVNMLRTAQFAEDAGPMAHPVRPESFIEISNFYTLTIYEKGAEVVRMIHTLLGEERFRQGSDLYFERHDGQAVTVEHFVAAMQDASGIDLSQFFLWYQQAATPEVRIVDAYDDSTQTYSLTFTQTCRETAETKVKQPFHIPVKLGLVFQPDEQATYDVESDAYDALTQVFHLTQAEQTLIFSNVASRPVPSLFRGFSAPVISNYAYSDHQLLALLKYDSDGFNKWHAAQTFSLNTIKEMVTSLQRGEVPKVNPNLIEAFALLLQQDELDPAMVAEMIKLPNESFLFQQYESIDVEAIHQARKLAYTQIAQALEEVITQKYSTLSTDTYAFVKEDVAKRRLKNTLLYYLAYIDTPQALALANKQYVDANNMTDQRAAFSVLAHAADNTLANNVIQDFYEKWKHDTLVLDAWFVEQATIPVANNLERVKGLMQHPAFSIKNPNKVRSLIGAFCGQNHIAFHQSNGSGYAFLCEMIMTLDTLNPQIASRLVTPFTKWRKLDAGRQALIKTALENILAKQNLSKDVYEVVSKSLKS